MKCVSGVAENVRFSNLWPHVCRVCMFSFLCNFQYLICGLVYSGSSLAPRSCPAFHRFVCAQGEPGNKATVVLSPINYDMSIRLDAVLFVVQNLPSSHAGMYLTFIEFTGLQMTQPIQWAPVILNYAEFRYIQ